MTTSAMRGAVLVALAALLGFLVLRGVADRAQVPVSSVTAVFEATPTPEPTTDVGAVTITEPTPVDLSTARPNAEVSVVVANGTEISGQAGRLTDTLRNQGFNTRQPANADVQRSASVIYFRPGYEVEAQVVRQVLNTSTPVAPIPVPDPLVGDTVDIGNADVVVLVGADALSTS